MYIALRSSTGCTIEKNVDYPHNDVNDGLEDKQPDMISCRTYCKSQNVDYFAWHAADSPAFDYRNSCWCKTDLPSDNKTDQNGVISGETMCNGN